MMTAMSMIDVTVMTTVTLLRMTGVDSDTFGGDGADGPSFYQAAARCSEGRRGQSSIIAVRSPASVPSSVDAQGCSEPWCSLAWECIGQGGAAAADLVSSGGITRSADYCSLRLFTSCGSLCINERVCARAHVCVCVCVEAVVILHTIC